MDEHLNSAAEEALMGAGFVEAFDCTEAERAFFFNRGEDGMIGVYVNHADGSGLFTITGGLPANIVYEADTNYEMLGLTLRLAFQLQADANLR